MSAMPWDDLKVAFGCGDPDKLWAARDAGRLPLPDGWSLVETDGTGARYVAIFRVAGHPSMLHGDAVRKAIAKLDSRRAATLKSHP